VNINRKDSAAAAQKRSLHHDEREEVMTIEERRERNWIKFTRDDALPHDRRLLMIGYPKPPNPDQEPDLFVAHWHEGKEEWVSVEPLRIAGRDSPNREIAPLFWAEPPDCPPGIELRALVDDDTYG
jgi:hypothetical protein